MILSRLLAVRFAEVIFILFYHIHVLNSLNSLDYIVNVTGESSSDCLSCDEKHILYEDQCVNRPDCYKGQFFNVTQNVGAVFTY